MVWSCVLLVWCVLLCTVGVVCLVVYCWCGDGCLVVYCWCGDGGVLLALLCSVLYVDSVDLSLATKTRYYLCMKKLTSRCAWKGRQSIKVGYYVLHVILLYSKRRIII